MLWGSAWPFWCSFWLLAYLSIWLSSRASADVYQWVDHGTLGIFFATLLLRFVFLGSKHFRRVPALCPGSPAAAASPDFMPRRSLAEWYLHLKHTQDIDQNAKAALVMATVQQLQEPIIRFFQVTSAAFKADAPWSPDAEKVGTAFNVAGLNLGNLMESCTLPLCKFGLDGQEMVRGMTWLLTFMLFVPLALNFYLRQSARVEALFEAGPTDDHKWVDWLWRFLPLSFLFSWLAYFPSFDMQVYGIKELGLPRVFSYASFFFVVVPFLVVLAGVCASKATHPAGNPSHVASSLAEQQTQERATAAPGDVVVVRPVLVQAQMHHLKSSSSLDRFDLGREAGNAGAIAAVFFLTGAKLVVPLWWTGVLGKETYPMGNDNEAHKQSGFWSLLLFLALLARSSLRHRSKQETKIAQLSDPVVAAVRAFRANVSSGGLTSVSSIAARGAKAAPTARDVQQPELKEGEGEEGCAAATAPGGSDDENAAALLHAREDTRALFAQLREQLVARVFPNCGHPDPNGDSDLDDLLEELGLNRNLPSSATPEECWRCYCDPWDNRCGLQDDDLAAEVGLIEWFALLPEAARTEYAALVERFDAFHSQNLFRNFILHRTVNFCTTRDIGVLLLPRTVWEEGCRQIPGLSRGFRVDGAGNVLLEVPRGADVTGFPTQRHKLDAAVVGLGLTAASGSAGQHLFNLGNILLLPVLTALVSYNACTHHSTPVLQCQAESPETCVEWGATEPGNFFKQDSRLEMLGLPWCRNYSLGDGARCYAPAQALATRNVFVPANTPTWAVNLTALELPHGPTDALCWTDGWQEGPTWGGHWEFAPYYLLLSSLSARVCPGPRLPDVPAAQRRERAVPGGPAVPDPRCQSAGWWSGLQLHPAEDRAPRCLLQRLGALPGVDSELQGGPGRRGSPRDTPCAARRHLGHAGVGRLVRACRRAAVQHADRERSALHVRRRKHVEFALRSSLCHHQRRLEQPPTRGLGGRDPPCDGGRILPRAPEAGWGCHHRWCCRTGASGVTAWSAGEGVDGVACLSALAARTAPRATAVMMAMYAAYFQIVCGLV